MTEQLKTSAAFKHFPTSITIYLSYMTHSIRVQVGPCYPRCPRSAECVALLSFGQRIVPSRGTGVMARLWLTRPQAHGVQVQLVRARRWFPRKCSKSLVSRCLIVERLKVQSTQPIAAVAKRGRNCTRLAARFGHKLSRELLEQLLHVRQRLCCRETSRLLWRAVCSGSGDRRKLVHEDGLRRGVRIQEGENANALDATRCTALALWLGSG